ncbi:MAG: DUF4214 domain-containing protein [Desulfovibrionales bacterium]|nr:MAG: DUF4214 domain-containing protein [Desulfovibrionales bacterium]
MSTKISCGKPCMWVAADNLLNMLPVTMRNLSFALFSIMLLAIVPCVASGFQPVTIQVDWTYAPPPGRPVAGYRLYRDYEPVCEIRVPATPTMNCPVDTTRTGKTSFTLTAIYSDASESSHSLPYAVTIPEISPEERLARDARLWITSFYVAYWGRAADPAGMDYWLDLVLRGALDIPGVAENFALSDEAREMYPYFNSPGTASDADRIAFVRGVYANLLNRTVAEGDEGVLYWVDVLRSGQTPPGLVIGYIIHAAIQANSTDWLTIWNKIQVAEDFTQHFQALGRPWQPSDTILARQALATVTHDPASVVVARFWVDQSLSP